MFPDTNPADKSNPILPSKSLESERTTSQPPSTFESYMQGAASQSKSSLGSTAPTSAAAGAVRAAPPSGAPTFNSLLAQAQNVQDSLGTVGEQIQTPNLKLKRSQSHLLKNKLQDSNEYIRSTAAKLGVENPPFKPNSSSSPVARFLSYIGDGQDQMLSVEQKLKELSATNGEMRPGDMMLIQVKMSQAQQEIEYSSTLLSKVIDSIKTIMNTQL